MWELKHEIGDCLVIEQSGMQLASYEYSETTEQWLKRFVELANGAPEVDLTRDLFLEHVLDRSRRRFDRIALKPCSYDWGEVPTNLAYSRVSAYFATGVEFSLQVYYMLRIFSSLEQGVTLRDFVLECRRTTLEADRAPLLQNWWKVCAKAARESRDAIQS